MLALDGAHVALWWVTLGLGLVVAIAVAALLTVLIKTVMRIDRNVSILWLTATHVARNTATTWTLSTMAERTGELRERLELGEPTEDVAGKGET